MIMSFACQLIKEKHTKDQSMECSALLGVALTIVHRVGDLHEGIRMHRALHD